MKTLSIVKAALGGGAAILLGGLLAAAPAQASTGRTVPCKTQAPDRRDQRRQQRRRARSTSPRDAPTTSPRPHTASTGCRPSPAGSPEGVRDHDRREHRQLPHPRGRRPGREADAPGPDHHRREHARARRRHLQPGRHAGPQSQPGHGQRVTAVMRWRRHPVGRTQPRPDRHAMLNFSRVDAQHRPQQRGRHPQPRRHGDPELQPGECNTAAVGGGGIASGPGGHGRPRLQHPDRLFQPGQQQHRYWRPDGRGGRYLQRRYGHHHCQQGPAATPPRAPRAAGSSTTAS